ncbi:hypothetical protein [Brachybacterium sp. Z12]|nr:hypothetical protein [Brachybacterium sp. Z12]
MTMYSLIGSPLDSFSVIFGQATVTPPPSGLSIRCAVGFPLGL